MDRAQTAGFSHRTEKNGTVIARDATYQNIVIKEDIPLGTRLWVTVTGHHRHYLLAAPV
ncbi:hypothetical protein [Methanogenium cariaci]|uniref:hypothetical protein n=1 Tax=Methanogenium cariaci TaxID=2197 RepID=UPI001FDEB897|nr:hypothetical protein [Methanogenium cariaci]